MRLGSFQKSAVWIAAGLVALTGLAWLVLHDIVGTEPGETERLLLMLHGIAAYAILVAIGSLLPLHVRSGWRRRRKRLTGAAMLTTLGLLGVTGLVLYYGGEQTRDTARWIHIGIGIASVALFPVHAMLTARQGATPPVRNSLQPATPAQGAPVYHHSELKLRSRSADSRDRCGSDLD